MAFTGIPQTFVHNSVGATLVTFTPAGAGSGAEAELKLGYAEDRIMIDERPIWEDIKNDAFGGQAGIPSDIQYLGSIAYVTCTLNRFIVANMELLSGIFPDLLNNFGTMPDMGSFVRQDEHFGILQLKNRTQTLVYSQAFLRQGRRFNLGVRHQQYMLVFECHVDDPCDMVLFTDDTEVDPCGA